MNTPNTSRLLGAVGACLLDLTNTEIQVAETRVAQAHTEAVRELTQNAENGGQSRAEAVEAAVR